MAKADDALEELVCMLERRALGLPEMQHRCVGRSTRVRDLLDSLFRGYPSNISEMPFYIWKETFDC